MRDRPPQHRPSRRAPGDRRSGPSETTTCSACGWTDDDGGDVVSRHHTSEGVIVWTRCVCGAVRARRHRLGPAEPVAGADPPHDWRLGP
ncbi:hypothetical protein O1R50_04870 [Glycomyces luteolus]|uniref:Uncharacterized protein n=1 Tax=Glycomyces luteolus TaxID=2670330 RepID=A0A9X3P5C8_9ACTN|nr:hypothetical protein [Glycomyces luteolus]MDA1358941.1 hypothetical protein [Glycomyces luteolus]